MKRVIASFLALIMICLVNSLFAGMSVASASSSNLSLAEYSYSGQPGESIEIRSSQACPNAGVAQDLVVLQVLPGSTLSTLAGQTMVNGTWGALIYKIPDQSPFGNAALSVQCKIGAQVQKTYDSLTVKIQAQSNSISQSNIRSRAQGSFSSSCTPGTDSVEAYITAVSSQQGSVGLDVVYNGTTSPAANGSWSMPVYVEFYSFSVDRPYFLQVKCVDNGNAFNEKTYKFYVESNNYVALGDSFSSGLGVFNYNLPNPDCHRSTNSYPYRNATTFSLGNPDFRACSGATTYDFFRSEWDNEDMGGQLESLNETTDMVTMTIGGNDAGFVDVLEHCLSHPTASGYHSGYSCANNTSLTGPLTSRLNALAHNASGPVYSPSGTLIYSIRHVLDSAKLAAPNAKIYIAGYPKLFGESSTNYATDGNAPGGYKCVVSTGPIEIKMSLWDAQWINDKTNELNGIIQDAVSYVNDPDIQYVSPSTFDYHGLCDSQNPWVNGVQLQNFKPVPESFHPNSFGVALGYGDAFYNTLAGY